jgi:hypothetical protein
VVDTTHERNAFLLAPLLEDVDFLQIRSFRRLARVLVLVLKSHVLCHRSFPYVSRISLPEPAF